MLAVASREPPVVSRRSLVFAVLRGVLGLFRDFRVVDHLGRMEPRCRLVDLESVLEAVAARPPHVEVITTGRRAPHELREAADLVTEMRMEKHPYEKGIAARNGIEY